MLALLKTSRALQVILVVVIAANLASGGMSDVALPSLAHASFGAAGYGALLACLAVGGLIGTLAATRTGGLKAPVMFASAVFMIEAAGICLIPYLGGEAGAAAALFVVGACNGLGNVTFLTVLQKWVAPGAARAGYEHADAVRVRQLPAVGGGFRSAGAPPRSRVVLPGGGRPGRGGDPGRADAAGVPGLRGGRERENPGRVSRNGGNADRGLKPGPFGIKENAR